MQGSRQTVLFARRAPTIKRWSLDARSEEQSAYFPWGSRGIRKPSLGMMARLGKPIAEQSEGMAVDKYLSAGWAGEKVCAQWKIDQPPSLRDNKRVGTGSSLVCKRCSALYRGRFQVPSATGDDARS